MATPLLASRLVLFGRSLCPQLYQTLRLDQFNQPFWLIYSLLFNYSLSPSFFPFHLSILTRLLSLVSLLCGG
jgi:hypothetical protein